MIKNQQITDFILELTDMVSDLQLSYNTKPNDESVILTIYFTDRESMQSYFLKFIQNEAEGEEVVLLSEIRNNDVEKTIIDDAHFLDWWNDNCYIRYEMNIDSTLPEYNVTFCKVAEDDELRLEPEDARKALYVCCRAADILALIKKYFKPEEISADLSGLLLA